MQGTATTEQRMPSIPELVPDAFEAVLALGPRTVAAWREAPYFTDAERAALALTEAVTRLSDRADRFPTRSSTRPAATSTNRLSPR